MAGEKKVKADQGLPRGMISRIIPAMKPAPQAGPHCKRPEISGLAKETDLKPLIIMKPSFEAFLCKYGLYPLKTKVCGYQRLISVQKWPYAMQVIDTQIIMRFQMGDGWVTVSSFYADS